MFAVKAINFLDEIMTVVASVFIAGFPPPVDRKDPMYERIDRLMQAMTKRCNKRSGLDQKTAKRARDEQY